VAIPQNFVGLTSGTAPSRSLRSASGKSLRLELLSDWAVLHLQDFNVMSRAFVKERDEEIEDVPERLISSHDNFVTVDGLAAIDRALTKFKAAYGAAVAKQNKTAIELTAREIRYWSARKRSAIVIEGAETGGEVRFGSTVTVRRHDGRVQTFRIVGVDEAELSRGSISYVSPFAQAVLGKGAGESIEIAGQEAEILSVD
jgi:transcription elongation GreA/GreB family factor